MQKKSKVIQLTNNGTSIHPVDSISNHNIASKTSIPLGDIKKLVYGKGC
ncbi:hypothetical protein PDR31_27475 [Bacillus cereus]|uniref:Uncharacterized protein n=1 Tax=Bacillus cereus VD154 TaxID=1053238 RepID=A0A9W5KR51_BACCE|nr:MULTISPECIES: hypothetical protein [Bacillus cereus group]MDA2583232.1 hypothetical protein [Bacillus cereus]EJR62983.1 hypothetical protein IK5_05903 [Bacillus cereus VD154]MEB8749759.1 hypothetical protein [Bacillus cereus]MEB8762465.1 hypothetical protein [Bacillus cereus]MEB8898334.1 hypothetical protein [Bacillus cereus]